MAQKKDIYVYMDWVESEEPIFMGVLHCETQKYSESQAQSNLLEITTIPIGCGERYLPRRILLLWKNRSNPTKLNSGSI